MGRTARTREARRRAAGLPVPATPMPKGALLHPETEQLLAARHEAAHVVVAHVQGVPVQRVTIEEREAVNAHASFVAFTGRGCGTPAENARISIAGRIQDWSDDELLGIERPDGSFEGGVHHDSESFKFWLHREADGDNERAAALVEPRMEEARATLNANNAGFFALVAALLERGALSEADILAILGPYPPVSAEVQAHREATKAALEAVQHGGPR